MEQKKEEQDEDPQDMAERFFPVESERMGTTASVVVLMLMLCIFVGMVGAILRGRDIH